MRRVYILLQEQFAGDISLSAIRGFTFNQKVAEIFAYWDDLAVECADGVDLIDLREKVKTLHGVDIVDDVNQRIELYSARRGESAIMVNEEYTELLNEYDPHYQAISDAVYNIYHIQPIMKYIQNQKILKNTMSLVIDKYFPSIVSCDANVIDAVQLLIDKNLVCTITATEEMMINGGSIGETKTT